ncbi:(2Fe-2S)-binding protein [Paracoccus sp. TOH]|uniref:(2Fe-2S)-binding protein n=1 Tax=Paracoccus sp. TOH TaxID=1263728 RepID=UPI0025B1EE6B|nr:(2Fe-2S)-binding protein [Paracoccus sp. TOH]WJS85366.1 (2Fe-2S)-binding protein [Paracoccus sp. TOH]
MGDFRLIPGVKPGPIISFTFNGAAMTGHQGESIASALLRAGMAAQRISARDGARRGYYCGMGQCWECAVWVEGLNTVRSCMEPVEAGMVIRTGDEGVR